MHDKQKNFYQRNGVWYYLAYVNGKRIRKSTGCAELADAKHWVDSRYPKKPRRSKMQDPFEASTFKVTTKFVSDMHYRMKSRFPDKPVMKRSELVALFEMAKGKCQLTGVPFVNYSVGGDRTRRPFIPSIDRIDAKKPYTVDNCRIVCLAVNLAMNEWGQDIFDLISFNRIKHRLSGL